MYKMQNTYATCAVALTDVVLLVQVSELKTDLIQTSGHNNITFFFQNRSNMRMIF